jgi:hypothetical protein
MSKLTLEFSTAPELRMQVLELADIIGAEGVPAPPNGESLALYSNEELMSELTLRAAVEGHAGAKGVDPAVAANEPTAEPAKKGRGRPKKEAAAATAEPPPSPAATPLAPTPKPDKAASSVAPDLPNEDDVMALISQVYSASNDMLLIRAVLQEVGGKTQLSQIPVNLWPALVARLNQELTRLQQEATP